MQEKQKHMEDRIEAKYETLVLSRTQVAEILNISTSTLDRRQKNGFGLAYSKAGEAKNATVEFSIDDVAEYIISKKMKVSL